MLEKCTVLTSKCTVLSAEYQCWKNAQYSRRKCVEVVGIPSSVELDQLQPTVWRILHHIGVNISGDKIEACHRLGKNRDHCEVFQQKSLLAHDACQRRFERS